MALHHCYLILAAQYESWMIPFSVILSNPLGVQGAKAGLMWRGMDNNVNTKVGHLLHDGHGAKKAEPKKSDAKKADAKKSASTKSTKKKADAKADAHGGH